MLVTTQLVAAGGVALHGGQHGRRIVALVVIVAVVVVVAVVVLRRRRPKRQATLIEVGTASAVPGDAAVAAVRSGASPGGPRGGSHILAKNLVKHYGTTVAVDDLSFTVEPGHVTGFLGPNGAGKSTTMRMIMGLDAPDRGSVTVGGRPFHSLGWPLREVGALLEAKAIHPGRTAHAHLWMLARSNDVPKRRVEEVLDLVGLTSVANQRVGGFSLGMGQRLGIAAALFDEPVNGLDTDGIRWVRQFLRRLASEGRTVFVSSHLMSEMAMTADRVVVIGQGRLIAETSVAEFTARSAHGYVRVRSPQLDALRPALEEAGATITVDGDGIDVRQLDEEKIGEIAWRHSILLHELAPRAASLEEAFVESTEGEVQFQGDRPRNKEGAP
jgi:ABC-2 type transport system ATP-binding protein